MSRAGGGSGKKGRPVTPEEAELWSRLASTVDKVKAKPRVTSSGDDSAPVPAPPAAPPPPVRAKEPAATDRPTSPKPAPAKPTPAPAPRRPPLAEPDRRAVRQIASGKTAIDGRIDLHGARQRDARARLLSFLRNAQANGCRTVLVITGKGGDAGTADPLAGALGEPQRGVLRRSVPQWLADPDLRDVVLGYTAAGSRHGGDGALYVQLRRLREG